MRFVPQVFIVNSVTNNSATRSATVPQTYISATSMTRETEMPVRITYVVVLSKATVVNALGTSWWECAAVW